MNALSHTNQWPGSCKLRDCVPRNSSNFDRSLNKLRPNYSTKYCELLRTSFAGLRIE